MRSPLPKVSALNPFYEKQPTHGFTVELLFLERNLMNLTLEENKDRSVSQTTEKEQLQYCNTFLDDAEEEELSEANAHPEFTSRDRLDSNNWNIFYGDGKSSKNIITNPCQKQFESDVQSMKIFLHTISQYCLKFGDYQSKSDGKYEILIEHEVMLRAQFKKKFIETMKDCECQKIADRKIGIIVQAPSQISSVDLDDEEVNFDISK
jgi:hypothetical protein